MKVKSLQMTKTTAILSNGFARIIIASIVPAPLVCQMSMTVCQANLTTLNGVAKGTAVVVKEIADPIYSSQQLQLFPLQNTLVSKRSTYDLQPERKHD